MLFFYGLMLGLAIGFVFLFVRVRTENALKRKKTAILSDIKAKL